MTLAFITHPDCLRHDSGLGHPECPERLQRISDELVRLGLDTILSYEQAPLVTRDQLSRVHDEKYIDSIFQLAPQEGVVVIDPDTQMSPYTLPAALRAAGSVVMAVDLVLSNKMNAAFCSVRPPGHHAERAQSMGFCFFNNIAVGIAHAIEQHHIKRITLIDFDAHRGNGTEDIFLNNKKVQICSFYEQGLYPFTEPPLGAKNIINIPLDAGSTGRELRAEFILHGLDAIKNFKPELIFISAGFDGSMDDPISNLNFTEYDYLWITRQIKQIADEFSQGRIISVLEGGYALGSLGPCVAAHIKGLLD